MTRTLFVFRFDTKDKAMNDVFDVVAQEARWLRLSRN
jgi:hypothetical protein